MKLGILDNLTSWVLNKFRETFTTNDNGDTAFRTSTVIMDSDGTEADVIAANGYNGLVAVAPGHISTDNSTSTPLDADAVYTGTWEDITNFGVVVVTVNSSHASATDGLKVCFSPDASNCDSDDVYTIPANTGKTFSFQAAAKYFRVEYTNGGTLQTSFRLQTVLKPYYVKPSSHRIQDSISTEDDAELTKAVITGENPAGTFVNFGATTSGNFKCSLEELESGVSSNNNSQLNVTVFDSGGTEQTYTDVTVDAATKHGLDVNLVNKYDRAGYTIVCSAIDKLVADSAYNSINLTYANGTETVIYTYDGVAEKEFTIDYTENSIVVTQLPSYLLQETGTNDHLLLEDGEQILLEQ